MTPLLAALSKQDTYVFVAAAVIVLAVAAFGWRDVSRFGFRRVRAIAGICFTEAVRRRVLWITPLAIVGVVAVTQLTRPLDEQDAIRQTTRYCLFATAMIVVVAAVLLACTNLPKEVESRVIFTIVTKPTTRLEIVLGKVLGFATVSGLILLIMGAFTFAYLEVRAWAMVSNARMELARIEGEERKAGGAAAGAANAPAAPATVPATGPATRPAGVATAGGGGSDPTLADADAAAARNRRIRLQTLRRYVDGGLLGTRAIQWPVDLEFFARDPGPGTPAVRWISGGQQTYCLAPVVLTDAQQQDIVNVVQRGHPAYLVVTATVDLQANPLPEELRELEQSRHPVENEVFGPMPSPSGGPPAYRPRILVTVRSAKTGQFLAKDVLQSQSGVGHAQDPVPDPRWRPGGTRQYRIPLVGRTQDPGAALAGLSELVQEGRFNVEIYGGTPTYEFGIGPTPAAVVVYGGSWNQPDFGNPVVEVRSSTTESVDPPSAARADDGVPPTPPGVRFYARFGRTGMQVIGRAPEQGDGTVAVYRFTDAGEAEAHDGRVVLQTKIGVDRGGDLDAERYRSSVASLTVRNRKTGFVSPPVEVEPQTGRLVEVAVPAAAVAGGDFDVVVRGRTPGQMLSLHGLTATVPSVALVRAEHPFALNLFKALLVLWLLSVLVVAISVFCSTFLSWPIAVVLTLLLLLGRWGVDTLGDALDPGTQRGVAQDLFKIRDPAKNKAVTDSLEALASVLRTVGPVLPDVGRFPVFEDIDRGVSMPAPKVGRALRELLVYGLPLVMLTYLFFKKKEVAP